MLNTLKLWLFFLLVGLTMTTITACYDDEPAVTRVMDIDLGSHGFKMLKITGMEKDYYIGLTEVTNGLWKAMMGSKPEGQSNDGDDYPVTMVSYEEITAKGGFLDRLNRLVKSEGLTFMLPTQAEWQFAAHGGQRTRGYSYSGSNSVGDVAWFSGNSGNGTHAVGTRRPNEIGIYDMSGCVWEMTTATEVKGNDGAETDVALCCGGGWSSSSNECHISSTSWRGNGGAATDVGFRLVLK